ncbi:DUF433 domain-containing protein [Hymenobacter sp. ASUV-10]|uniref:DUF433 domain-containing protein n=1 Tax=Hymenobacter aranciens TaxID=3063996 RepID=A0ABT9BGR9_9BACT|nr:DUF433 domain-containing protein [Hymenobacter sp. ASUV-10]MDO7876985.1 DUF433 domain-containing protein [Hymenobacter sp. ASUV-10]
MPLNWRFSDDVPFNGPSSETSAERAIRWEGLKQQVSPGTPVSGRVFIQAPFGVFFDAGLGFSLLLEILDFGFPGIIFPDDYPALDSIITGEVAGFRDDNKQIAVVKDYAAIFNPDLSERLRYQEEGRLPDHPLISIHPKVRLGYACLIGTSISVIDVLDHLAGSLSFDSAISTFPGLTKQMIRACLQYASDREKHIRPAGW